jgi:peroxin-16
MSDKISFKLLFVFLHMTYSEFVTKQAPVIAQIESTLKSLSFVLPGRFKDSEIISEALYSGIKLLGHYHDHILYSQVQTQNPQKETEFNRYIRFALKDFRFGITNHTLAAVSSLQTFLEMAALKCFNKKVQEKGIVYITLLKTMLRLTMFELGAHKMLLHSQTLERTFDLSRVDEKQSDLSWKSSRTNKEYKSVRALQKTQKTFEEPMEFLLSKAGEIDAKSMLRELNGYERFKEYMYILVPLLYVVLLKKYGKSYKAFIPCFLVHVWTLYPDSNSLKTEFERKEEENRKWLLLYYFLQFPLYETFTKKKVESIAKFFKGRLLFGAIGTVLNDYTNLWDNYHFYTVGY